MAFVHRDIDGADNFPSSTSVSIRKYHSKPVFIGFFSGEKECCENLQNTSNDEVNHIKFYTAY